MEIEQIHPVAFEHHPDGLWNTTRYKSGNTTIIVKSRQGKGVKYHFQENGVVVKTYRFNVVNFKKIENHLKKYLAKWEASKKVNQ